MKTSVTSPYCIKNCRRSSVVMSSVQRPTNTLRLLNGSSRPCCVKNDGGKKQFYKLMSITHCVKKMSIMCGYMHGHYHIHLRVRELAITPSPINHMALRDHLLLSLILREPNKAKSLRVTGLGFSFNLRPKQKQNKKHSAIKMVVTAYNTKH